MDNDADKQDSDSPVNESSDGRSRGRLLPAPLRLAALAIIVVASAWWIIDSSTTPPTIEAQSGSDSDGYRLITGRTTPPDAAALSEDFIPVRGLPREQVLQQLSEFRARWKVSDPRVEVNVYDVTGDAVAVAEQLEGWLQQYGLLSSAPATGASDGRSQAGDQESSSQTMSDSEFELPAPPSAGLSIRARDSDMAIARDLALTLAPVVGGDVNLRVEERVPAGRIVVDLVGAPRFGEDGVAYFDSH